MRDDPMRIVTCRLLACTLPMVQWPHPQGRARECETAAPQPSGRAAARASSARDSRRHSHRHVWACGPHAHATCVHRVQRVSRASEGEAHARGELAEEADAAVLGLGRRRDGVEREGVQL